MTGRGERTVHAAVALHVIVTVVFLVCVAGGAGARLLIALGLGVVATMVWIGWTRTASVEHAMRTAGPMVVPGSTVSINGHDPNRGHATAVR